LVIATVVYHIWTERNRRFFQNISRSNDCVKDAIIEDVKLRLAGLRVKNSAAIKEVAALWNIHWNPV
ncbi:hypothetical protein Tco_1258980, partial [Tanacetum coccineum]